MVWAIKDHSIGHAYFDEGAAVFFLPHLVSQATDQMEEEEAGPVGGGVAEISPFKRHRYTVIKSAESAKPEEASIGKDIVGGATAMGGALGPDWHSDLKMAGKALDEVNTAMWLSCDYHVIYVACYRNLATYMLSTSAK